MDPITLQVLFNRLSGIVEEMQANIFRTGYSTIVRESQDASCMILDPEGAVVGEHVILPLHISALPEVIRAIRHDYQSDIHEGDAFLTNHPYLSGVTHAVDMAVAVPVFADSRLVAWCASIAHRSDLGGMYPGSGAGNAREIFQECVLYPPVRIEEREQRVHEVEAIIRANSRTPDMVWGDIRGQIGTRRMGAARLQDLIVRYGLAAFQAALAAIQDHSEHRLRQALAAWPDGEAEGEAFVDHDGIRLDHPIHYHVRIVKKGDQIALDFRQSADQALGPVNVGPALVRGCCYYVLVALVDPALPNNGGIARVVETHFRRGSVLDPVFPASTNTYMASATAATEALMDAFGRLIPEKRVAPPGGVGGMTIASRDADGHTLVQYELIGSGYGAHYGGDGASGTSVLLDNAKTASIEIVESEFSVRLCRFGLIPDSGGIGRWHGGLGIQREYEILGPVAQLSLRGGKHQCRPAGLDGGGPGRAGALWVNSDTPQAKNLPSRFSGFMLAAGDRFRVEKAGGGGLGDPATRPRSEVIDDVIDGYVSRTAAMVDYGVSAEEIDDAEAIQGGRG